MSDLRKELLCYSSSIKSKISREYILSTGEDRYYRKNRKYAGTTVYNVDLTHQFIKESIGSGKPFMVGRFGANELNAMSVFDFKRENKYNQVMNQMVENAGFFPNDYSAGCQFSELMKESCKQIDCLGVWNLPMEPYYIRQYCSPDIVLTHLRHLEPWESQSPWTKGLVGKKVLVIHPFEETIRSQYENRTNIFENRDILPKFELITLKAVQTIAGQKNEKFDNWFEALNYMFDEAMNIDFDIALIGCGAYGFPLAAKLKQAGKQAIHMGGVLQILFGIKGSRWNSDPTVSSFYNEYWVRPLETETPKSYKNIEDGCYW